ncbi:MAG: hypothetical protein EOP10_29045, partial [Proteobacteria bacterium]
MKPKFGRTLLILSSLFMASQTATAGEDWVRVSMTLKNMDASQVAERLIMKDARGPVDIDLSNLGMTQIDGDVELSGVIHLSSADPLATVQGTLGYDANGDGKV